jgi:hypothetical protein
MAGTQTNTNQRAAVEQIVRAVLAELRSGHAPAKITTPQGASNTQLTLTSKVVSFRELEGRLTGITQLVVPRGAVFTPTARDELRKYKVTVASAVSPAKTAGGTTLHVASAGTTYNAAPIWQSLVADGVHIESTVAAELTSAISVLGDAAGKGGTALLVTEQVATALCLANRNRFVRAAIGNSTSAVDAAVAEIGPNLLVIDPTGRSVFDVKQTIRHWLRHGQPKCPAGLATQLN